jgi:hypothetical protein
MRSAPGEIGKNPGGELTYGPYKESVTMQGSFVTPGHIDYQSQRPTSKFYYWARTYSCMYIPMYAVHM